MNNTLISFDIRADFGMLKKPDTNEPVYLTFNMLHKPALLGILGAIAGLKGFSRNGKFPEYYQKLMKVKISIIPLDHENGNFTKTIIKYNNGTGLASEETGGNLMVAEQTLIAPAFRCFTLLDIDDEAQKKLYENIFSFKAEFVPYLGKNDCSVWWENVAEFEYSKFGSDKPFKIDSLFIKQLTVKDSKVDEPIFDLLMDSTEGNTFTYFEYLPIGYLGHPLFQYEYRDFAFTDWDLSLKKGETGNLIRLANTGKNEIIQLF